MKKAFILSLLFLLLTTVSGCGGKDNPTDAEIVEAFKQNETVNKSIKNISTQSSEEPHGSMYQVYILDSRYTDLNNDYDVQVEVFNNNQDAQIRYDYLSLVNAEQEAFTKEKEFWNNGNPILQNKYLYIYENIVSNVDGHLSEADAKEYFSVLDNLLSDNRYKQTNTLKDDEYTQLYESMVTLKKTDIDSEIESFANDYLIAADKTVNEAIDAAKNNLNDDTVTKADDLIINTYKGRFYDNKRTGWVSSLNELKAVKAQNELEYDEKINEIEALLLAAEETPNENNLNKAKEAIESLDMNYYYSKYIASWNEREDKIDLRIREIARDNNVIAINSAIEKAEAKLTTSTYEEAVNLVDSVANDILYKDYIQSWRDRLSSVDIRIKEIERDNNVAALNKKLDKVEKTLDTALYDEITEEVNQYSKKILYKDYISDWKSRLQAISADIADKKHREEIAEFKKSCSSIKYDEFFRNSDDYLMKPLYFKGEVVQVVSQNSKGATLRVNVTRNGSYYTYYTDTIYVEYDNSDDIDVSKILEDDIIEMWGYGAGDVTYQTVLGATVTIPALYAKYINIK